MLSGVFTAIITPFKEDGSVDYDAYKVLVEKQVAAGVAGIVPCGTTGESPTLSTEEMKELIALSVDLCQGKIKVIAGTGSNSTHHALELTKQATALGVDACMVVNPYYNKPTQEGLYLHFKTIADAVDTPIVIYNIKGRTGVNVETKTLVRLMNDCANIVGVKEASGDLNQMKDVIMNRKDGFSVLSGDDNMTLELVQAGGDGVISVASNIMPEKMVTLVTLAKDGQREAATQLHEQLSDWFSIEFVETNPIPIKTALALQGICTETFRLPMCAMDPDNKKALELVLKQYELM